MSELNYIRETYGVPAYRGRRIRFTHGEPREGVILSGSGPYIRVRFDGEKISKRLHPTWEVEYLPTAKGESGE
jgi:hypothetical protein